MPGSRGGGPGSRGGGPGSWSYHGEARLPRVSHARIVFVSHAWGDRWIAKQLAAEVARAGAECFLDVVDIEVGDDVDVRIWEGLRRCSELMVLLTPISIDRRWIWIEIGGAWAQGKRVVGVVQGMSVDELLRQVDVPLALRRKDLVDINEVDRYLGQLKRRGTGANRP